MRPLAQQADKKRYTTLEGIEVGEQRGGARKIKIGGDWHWVPVSVIHRTTKNIGAADSDSAIIEEWYVKNKGWI